MILDFIIVANNAFTDEVGRLNIIQTFDKISSPKFPAIHPQMSIVTKWIFEEKDNKETEHNQTITIKHSETGIDLIPPQKKPLKSKNGVGAHLQFIMNLMGVKFDKPGTYVVEATMDDKSSKKTAILVEQINAKRE